MNIGIYHSKAGTRDSGGVAIFVQEIAKRLSKSHSVYLYTERGKLSENIRNSTINIVQVPPFEDTFSSSKSHFVPSFGSNILRNAALFASALADGVVGHINENVDVLLTHGCLGNLLLSNVVDVPVIHEYHMLQKVGYGARIREWFSETDVHLANSKRTAEEVFDEFEREVDGIVNPGVDTDRFHPNCDPAFEEDEFAVLFVGRVVEDKGVHDLVDAIARMSTDAQLYVVGRGEKSELREQADELGIDDSVTFEGAVQHHELPRYYNACDVFCSPSYYEAFGMTNLEAMACSKPVVTTDIAGISEYAVHEETNLLVEPGAVDELAASLDRLAASPELRRGLGTAGRAVATEHSWDAQAAELARHCEASAETAPVDGRFSSTFSRATLSSRG